MCKYEMHSQLCTWNVKRWYLVKSLFEKESGSYLSVIYIYLYDIYIIFGALIYKIIICHTVKYDSGGLPNATFLDNTHEMIIVFVWLCRFRSRILFNVPIICPYDIRYIESKATHCCFVAMIFSSQELFYHLKQLISL